MTREEFQAALVDELGPAFRLYMPTPDIDFVCRRTADLYDQATSGLRSLHNEALSEGHSLRMERDSAREELQALQDRFQDAITLDTGQIRILIEEKHALKQERDGLEEELRKAQEISEHRLATIGEASRAAAELREERDAAIEARDKAESELNDANAGIDFQCEEIAAAQARIAELEKALAAATDRSHEQEARAITAELDLKECQGALAKKSAECERWHVEAKRAAQQHAQAMEMMRTEHPRLAAALHPRQEIAGKLDRDYLGRVVRMEWIAWAKEQPNPKASWLQSWEELTEPEREVDRRIGLKVVEMALISNAEQSAVYLERLSKAEKLADAGQRLDVSIPHHEADDNLTEVLSAWRAALDDFRSSGEPAQPPGPHVVQVEPSEPAKVVPCSDCGCNEIEVEFAGCDNPMCCPQHPMQPAPLTEGEKAFAPKAGLWENDEADRQERERHQKKEIAIADKERAEIIRILRRIVPNHDASGCHLTHQSEVAVSARFGKPAGGEER